MSEAEKVKVEWTEADEARYQLLRKAKRYVDISKNMEKTPEYIEFLKLNIRRLEYGIAQMEK